MFGTPAWRAPACGRFLVLLLVLLAAAPAAAAQEITVEDVWMRPPLGNRGAAAIYLTIHNAADVADRLVAVSSPAAGRAEIHTHILEDGVARMRRIEGIDISPGGSAILAPGGDHLMLFDLADGLMDSSAAGHWKDERLRVVLEFAVAGTVEADFEVRMMAPDAPDAHAH